MEKDYVGAMSVACNCPVCRSCLVLYEILYLNGSQITKETAREQQIKCVKCDVLLAEPKMIRTRYKNSYIR